MVITGISDDEPVVPGVATPLVKSITGVAPPVEVILPVVPLTEVTVPTLIDPPRLVLVPFIVMAELTSAPFGIDVRLAPEPLNVVAETVLAKVALLSWSMVTAVTWVVVVFGVTLIKVLAPRAVAPHASVATPSNDAWAYPLEEVVP
jgi:hypothetical protein